MKIRKKSLNKCTTLTNNKKVKGVSNTMQISASKIKTQLINFEKKRRLVYFLNYKMTHLHIHVTRRNFATC